MKIPPEIQPHAILAVPEENRTGKPSALNRLSSLDQERAWVTVDLEALAHNVRSLKTWVGSTVDLMAVVKADAYGHGAIAITKTALASGANWLAVATLEEGIQLREAGIQAPILVLGFIQNAVQIKSLIDFNLDPTLCTLDQAERLAEVAAHYPSPKNSPKNSLQNGDRPTPLRVHLNIDTGMSRLGVPWPEARSLVERIYQLPSLKLVSVYSHFATADEPDILRPRRQRKRFEQAIAPIITQIQDLATGQNQPLPKFHMANSAAILSDRAFHYDLVRPGLAIYGICPAKHLSDRLELKPVLSVHARVTQIRTIAPGEGVSYGHRFIAQRPTRVAAVGIGYADGVPRNLSGQLSVLFQNQLVPQIGSITMDQILLDATDVPDLHSGDVVTLLGNAEGGGDRTISAQDWADQLGTISWEILCGFKHRLPRITLPAAAPANPET